MIANIDKSIIAQALIEKGFVTGSGLIGSDRLLLRNSLARFLPKITLEKSNPRATAFNSPSGVFMKPHLVALAITLLCAAPVLPAQQIALSDLTKAKLKSSTAEITNYQGSQAFRLIPIEPNAPGYAPGGPLAILDNIHFRNGTIDVDVAGQPAKGANESARGFIGVVFRVQSESRFEIIYLRPTNSHADDQLRRNHTTQYSSEPDWPWERLRKESPGVYESWVDIETGKWTHMRIEVNGTNASLYVNQAKNPCLIVHDLKLGDTEGSVGLWMGQDTQGYFRNLTISKQ